jgi:hypothetical protein
LSAARIRTPADGVPKTWRDDAADNEEVEMNRKLMWAVLAIGLALVIAPFALSLPSKASAGERMLNDFQPIMQPNSVASTADYYDNVFTKLRPVALAFNAGTVARFRHYQQGLGGMQKEEPALVAMLATQLGMTPQQVQQLLAQQFPATAQMFQSLPQMGTDFTGMVGLMDQNVGTFKRVPSGLDHYQPLVSTMQANVDNYKQVNSLPSFRLFAWFFVIPGVLLIALSGYGLWADRTHTKAAAHHARPTPA